jgi:hypothetical protein
MLTAVNIQIHVMWHSCSHAVHCWCLQLLMAVGGGWRWWEVVGLTIDGVVMMVGVEVSERVNMSDLG